MSFCDRREKKKKKKRWDNENKKGAIDGRERKNDATIESLFRWQDRVFVRERISGAKREF